MTARDCVSHTTGIMTAGDCVSHTAGIMIAVDASVMQLVS